MPDLWRITWTTGRKNAGRLPDIPVSPARINSVIYNVYFSYTFHSRIPVELVPFESITMEIALVFTGVKVVVLY